MGHLTELKNLGERICIIGPSSSGKSTLAKALGDKLGIDVFHLDQLAHVPNTNWQPRDRPLLAADHQQILQSGNQWIIEGNYSFLMQERFSLATSIIWLDFGVAGSLYRYLKRTWKNSTDRPGNLSGSRNQFSFKLIHHMLFTAPKNRAKYQKLAGEGNALLIRIRSFKKLKEYYRWWAISLK